jgi:hypothetical protein
MTSLDEFYAGGPKTWQEAFPPICVTSHWSPTEVSRHILPQNKRLGSYAMDPRPSARICTSYYNTSPGDAPLIQEQGQEQESFFDTDTDAKKDSDVIPVGAGRGFAYEVYANNIGVEDDLLRLREPLTKCAEKRYVPRALPVHTNVLPFANISNSSSLSPLATEVQTQAGCRQQDDEAAWNRSSRLFFNPTRYDRDPRMPRIEGRNGMACDLGKTL